MADPIYLVTPVGRLVQGDCFVGSTKNMEGGVRTTRDGKPSTQWFMALAIPKGPEFDTMWAQIAAKGALDFPGGESARAGFAWKVVDGDSQPDHEGFPGHWVIRMTSGFAPKVLNGVNVASPQPLLDQSQAKRGNYFQFQLAVQGNGSATRPGVYLNPNLALVVGYGPEIQTGPDPAQVFAQRGTLPAGASLSPPPALAVGVGAQPPATLPQPGAAVPGAPVPGVAVPTQTAPLPVAAPAPVVPGVVVPTSTVPIPAAVPAPAVPGAVVPPATGLPPAPGFLNPDEIPY